MKSVACALFFTFALLCSPACAQTLSNPGFEGDYTALPTLAPDAKAQITGEVAPGWTDNTGWTTTTIGYARDTAVFHSGAASQRVEATSGFVQFAQYVTFPQTGTYQASLWLKAQTPTWVQVSLRQADSPYTTFAGTPVKVGTDWKQVSVCGSVPAGNQVLLVNIGTDSDIKSPGATIWIDDADLHPAAPAAQTLSPPKTSIPASYFGMNANGMHDAPGYDWPALPFGTFRSWDSGVIWPTVETGRGAYNWATMDTDVANAQKHSAQYLFTLGLCPQWAAPGQPNTYAGVADVPDDLNDYTAFVSAVAARYGKRVQDYEVWNEPDIRQFYTGTPAQLVPLEGALAQAVHAVNPAARICTPPVSGVGLGSVQWLDAYLAAGGGRQADTVSCHLYSNPPETDIVSLQLIKSVLAPYGLDKKPVWNTETGMQNTGQTEQEAAAHVARVALMDWAAGFQRFCWYAYDNGPQYVSLDAPGTGGRRDPATLAPSGVAYREVRGWLVGSRMLSCGADTGGLWTAKLVRADKTTAYAVWETTGTRTFAVPAAWRVTQAHDLAGHASVLTGGRVAVGPAPLLLTPASP